MKAALSDIGWLLLVLWALPLAIVLLGLPLAAVLAVIHNVLSRIW